MEYKVNLEKFTGPLDLLLSLIEDKKLAINEISLSQVTDQFLEYFRSLESATEITAEYKRILADFLVVASRLILIKSYSLLPNLVLSDEDEEDIKDLEERLEIYKKIKIMAKEIGKLTKDNPPYFSRESYFNIPAVFYPPVNVSGSNLSDIYESFLKTLPQIEKLEEQSIRKIITIEEKIRELTGKINIAAEASFANISGGKANSKIEVILTFLALLMLFRNRILIMNQDELFGDIKIKSLSSNQNG